MTGWDSLNLLDAAVGNIRSKYCFQLVLDSDFAVGTGRFSNAGTSDEKLIVGIHGLSNDRIQNISLSKAVTPVVDAYHELGHALHFHELYRESSDLSKAIALSNTACLVSPAYYNRHNVHPHEIAAEYFGFYGARDFLSRQMGQRTADKMLCAYANEQSVYFSDDPGFTSVSDILDALNHQFENSVLQHKSYDRAHDPFVKMRKFQGFKRDPISEGLLHFASSAGYGMMQDYAMSVMTLDYLEDRTYKWKPVFEDLEMDPGNALEILKGTVQVSYPKPRREVLQLSATERLLRAEAELSGSGSSMDLEYS